MSITRHMIEDLRVRMGHTRPLSPPKPIGKIAPPPKRIMVKPQEVSEFAVAAAEHTTALVGIGHVGTRYATNVVLQFQAELAVAHEAVDAVLPDGWAETNGLLGLQ